MKNCVDTIPRLIKNTFTVLLLALNIFNLYVNNNSIIPVWNTDIVLSDMFSRITWDNIVILHWRDLSPHEQKQLLGELVSSCRYAAEQECGFGF